MLFLTLFSFAVLGALCGSFIGVVSERAYTGQSWKRGRSRCNSCREDLRGRDLLPIVSWLLNRGRCRMCRSRITAQYVIFEMAFALLFALSYLHLGIGIPLVFLLLSVLALGFVVIYDVRHKIVPPAGSFLLLITSAAYAVSVAPDIAALGFTVLVASGIALFFFLLYALSGGRAMGLGDTPVAFALSLLLGPLAIAGMLFSFWIGAVIGIGILVLRPGGPRMGIEVPFVPFLALGYLLAFFTQWNPLPF